jgi:hypothetical protein
MKILLNQLGFTKIKEIKKDVCIVKSIKPEDNTLYIYKSSSAQEITLYSKVFPKISQKQYKKLILPEALMGGSQMDNAFWWLIEKYYEGQIMQWSEHIPESAGGRLIPHDAITDILDLIEDMLTIDITIVKDVVPVFDYLQWLTIFEKRGQELVSTSLLKQEDFVKAKKKFYTYAKKQDFLSKSVFTNGDFYFRNFIKTIDQKIVLIDWTNNYSDRSYVVSPSVEPLPVVIMYLWSLMWNNLSWRKDFLSLAMERFGLNTEEVTLSLMIKSFNQAHFYYFLCNDKELAKYQIEHFKMGVNSQNLLQ